ncbi:MAG: hypothetical protein HZB23_10430 [Deltaproteobacteria bacterium]|nr:hypothetical protein [Deltaproteobacteria bacterium]
MKRSRALKFAVFAIFVSAFLSFAAPPAGAEEPVENISVLRQGGGAKLRTLGNIVSNMKDLKAQEESLTRLLNNTKVQDERDAVSEELKTVSGRISQLESDFTRIAAGVNPSDLSTDMKDATSYDWKSEIQDFLTPLFMEMKDFTARPRSIAKLRQEMAFYSKRRDIMTEAVSNLSLLAEQTADADLKTHLEKAVRDWQARKEAEENRVSYLEHQIESLESEKTSIFDSGRSIIKSFFKSRGRNLVLAALAFFVFFMLMRAGHRRISRHSPWHRQPERGPFVRMGDLAYHAVTLIGSVGAMLVVLYVSEDWVLLSLAVIFILGLAWTAKQGLSQFFEQFKILLNLGPVRENEKVIYNGIPWLVSSINLYSALRNPTLSGADIRLPISAMRGMVSRPFSPEEPWFPSNTGDWLMLSDGVFGRVALQSPESVVMALLGGAFKTYPTQDFLSLAPLNLSKGFRLVEVFGVDYRHQEIVTRKIPQIMKSRVEQAINDEGWGKFIVNIGVVFKTAGAYSLDFEVICDFSGDGAPYYRGFQRVLNTCFVETATEMGWNIPFNTLTLKT